DCKIVSTLSSCAESMNEQVLTITTSASAASLVISMPPFIREPSMISASTRFFAQPREIMPTRTGRAAELFFSFIKARYPKRCFANRATLETAENSWMAQSPGRVAHLPDRGCPHPQRRRTDVRPGFNHGDFYIFERFDLL